MSRAAKATLAASIVATTFTVWFVHYQQQQEHEVRLSLLLMPVLHHTDHPQLATMVLWVFRHADDVQGRATR